MNILEILLISIGMGMDCFAISLATGVMLKKDYKKTMLSTAFSFAFFHTIMPIVGWLCAKSFRHLIEDIDHWIAFFILSFIGMRMIINYLKGKTNTSSINPTNMKVLLSMSVATSIDALVIGISFALLGMNTLLDVGIPSLILGFVAFIMSAMGMLLGVKSNIYKTQKTRVELWGGLILILIGLKTLIEHTMFN